MTDSKLAGRINQVYQMARTRAAILDPLAPRAGGKALARQTIWEYFRMGTDAWQFSAAAHSRLGQASAWLHYDQSSCRRTRRYCPIAALRAIATTLCVTRRGSLEGALARILR